MATIQVSCQNCGTIVAMGVGQHLQGKRIFWSAGYNCPVCDFQLEMDDQGDTPSNIRQAILEEEGIWFLRISETENRTKAMMTLRAVLGLSISDISKLRKQIPGIIASGTQLEMKIIQNSLLDAGVNAVISRANNEKI